VIILAGGGPHLSAGHDLRADWTIGEEFTPVSCWGGFANPGPEGYLALEEEKMFLGMCWRWRNLPEPTIAATQGKTIAGGPVLAWS
jgi:enoyl-CoA hydratase